VLPEFPSAPAPSAFTGYVTDGPVEFPERAPFPDRVPAVIAAEPDVVLVAGGINDTDRAYSEDRLRTAITGTLSGLQQGLPEAQIVVVGPWWPTGYPTESAEQVDDIVTEVAASLDLPVVSPIDQGWITGTADGVEPGNRAEFIGPDGAHPSQAGHDYLADRLYEWLRAAPGLPTAG
jgi:lysophospholipase L1-like esterase